MKIFIKSALIIDKNSRHHSRKRDILIKDGIIEAIGAELKPEGQVIEHKGLRVSPGWFDMRANFCDPGYEYKEDILSGCRAASATAQDVFFIFICRAASAGGFTGVAILPNTKPVIQSKNEISYVLNKAKNCITDVYPYGAVTHDAQGEDLTEILDQFNAGCIAVTDGEKPLWNTDILYKTLQYLRKIEGLVINKPEDKWLNMLGLMHEGKTSAMLGLKGMPRIAEEVMVERDIRILDYSGGRLHLSNISTSESVKLIRQAKRKGLSLSCDIAAYQLAFDDSALMDFDTNLKLNPPLREKSDIRELTAGLRNGTIDAVVSSHSPQDIEGKRLEYDLAEYGMTGLQTVYPLLNRALGEKNDDLVVDVLSINPRKILGLETPAVAEGASANLTLFNPDTEWILDENSNFSKSQNSPLWGKKLKGKVIGVINKKNHFFNQ